jgi:hypothetical protein
VSENKDDYELIHKDETYSFFRVHTTKDSGNRISCLVSKTKSNGIIIKPNIQNNGCTENRFLKE